MVSLLDPSPAYLAFQQQVANPPSGLPVPPVAPAQVAYQQQPQAYPQEIPPWLLPSYDPPGVDAADRGRAAKEEQIRREQYQADLLAGRVDIGTLWKNYKGAQFAGNVLPYVFPGAYALTSVADRFLPDKGFGGKVKGFISDLSIFEQNRLDEAAHHAALLKYQGLYGSESPAADRYQIGHGLRPPPSLLSTFKPHPAEFGGQAFDATQAVGYESGAGPNVGTVDGTGYPGAVGQNGGGLVDDRGDVFGSYGRGL